MFVALAASEYSLVQGLPAPKDESLSDVNNRTTESTLDHRDLNLSIYTFLHTGQGEQQCQGCKLER
jgi:hypothetical protein